MLNMFSRFKNAVRKVDDFLSFKQHVRRKINKGILIADKYKTLDLSIDDYTYLLLDTTVEVDNKKRNFLLTTLSFLIFCVVFLFPICKKTILNSINLIDDQNLTVVIIKLSVTLCVIFTTFLLIILYSTLSDIKKLEKEKLILEKLLFEKK